MDMGTVERLDLPPPDDGKTLDSDAGGPDGPPEGVLAISALPDGKQFDVLKDLHRADADHTKEWRAMAEEWFLFRAGEQWTAEDRALLNSQQRPHIVFNRVLTILKAVAGMEINGRHEITFIPRGTMDTAVNEVLSAASKWMADETDAEDEESQAFDDCCTVGMGWCLSDDALVRLPNTHFATTCLYSGSIVQIGLENGKELTGTPNHPVLTDMGWKRLCDLHEGDNLVNSAFLERVQGLPVEQFDKVETRLKDKIDAFRTGRESLRFATAPDDFYADGIGSKVHVVYADSLLLNKFRKDLHAHEVKEFKFSWSNFLALCGSAFFSFRHAQRAITATISQAALDWIHAPFSVLLRGVMLAQSVPSFAQSSSNGLIGTVEFLANFKGGHAFFEIEPDQIFDRNWERNRAAAPRAHNVSSLPKPIANRRPRYSQLIADFFDWKPLLEIEARKLDSRDIGSLQFLTPVKFRADRVVNNFAVHDVGTSLGFFVAGNIITSNTESRMSYEDDPAGLYIEDCIDPREMYWDRTATKKNVSNARRLSRVRRMPLSDALALFPGKTIEQLDAAWADPGPMDYPKRTIEEKRKRDRDNSGMAEYDDNCEVTIVQMQWFERETYWIVADTQTNTKAELSDAEYRRFEARMKVLGMPVHAAKLQRKAYKQAWLGGELLQKAGPAPIKGKFSWDCVTGEFDKAKKYWFGLVKIMRDPQMWANKWLSQILHILNTTAKGGILAETSAFDDQREAEEGYARPDTITWLAEGSLSGDKPKIMPKPGAGMTDGYLGSDDLRHFIDQRRYRHQSRAAWPAGSKSAWHHRGYAQAGRHDGARHAVRFTAAVPQECRPLAALFHPEFPLGWSPDPSGEAR